MPNTDNPNTLLDFDLGDDLAFEPAPAEEEVQFHIEKAFKKESKAGENLSVVMALVDYPEADVIYYTVWLPQPSDEPRDVKRKLIGLKTFYEAFGIDHSGPVDMEADLKGALGWGIVGQEEYQGVVRNTVKKLVAPK